MATSSAAPDRQDRWRADCTRCVGLCCVALAFSVSADFAIDKQAGEPCPNLGPDFGCGIHADLRQRGFPGCTAYDCFGAGQQVTQVTFGATDWRSAPETAQPMFDAFATMRQLHELLWYLSQALTLNIQPRLHAELSAAFEAIDQLTLGSAPSLVQLDLDGRRSQVGALLREVSRLVRVDAAGPPPDHSRADLMGADLRSVELRDADLRGSYLIGADLRGADLGMADLLGADLRGAQLGGTDLSACLFLTQTQVNAANGDAATRLPTRLLRPSHW